MMKITTLIENNPDESRFLAIEHGLSLFIEADGLKILFDCGQSGLFIENARHLGINLQELDYIVLSHGHYDHANGLKPLLEILETKPKLIVSSEFFRKKSKQIGEGQYRYNGINFDEDFLSEKLPIVKVAGDALRLSETVSIHHHFQSTNEFETLNPNFFYDGGKGKVPDDFADEIALTVKTKRGLVVVAGCSHVGIVNILTKIATDSPDKIYGVVGGTHLVEANLDRINKTIQAFKNYGLEMVAVSHCTGEEGLKMIKAQFPVEFVFNNTGNVIELD